jgi:hypothetical protein
MKFHLPGLPTMSALMLSSVLSAWLGIAGPVNLSVIKEWQTSIGFLVALFVGWIAWVNVNRTLKQQRASTRITLVGREEDRIERELPNMRDLELFVGMLCPSSDNLRQMAV